ncbi:MAG: ATP-binding protein [Cytophagales bacterium]|nr:ATP-binding protein [Cytophagales bacterium]
MRNKPIGKYVFLWISVATFLVAVGYKYSFVTSKNTPEKNATLVSSKIQRELDTIEPLIVEITSIIKSTPVPDFSALLLESKYSYFIFTNRRISFWSDNLYNPKYRDILGDFKVSYVETSIGKYLVRKEQLIHEERLYDIVFLIPIVEHPAVINEYLKKTYNEDLFTDSSVEVSYLSNGEEYRQIEVNGNKLFSVKFGNTYTNSDKGSRRVLILLVLAAFAFICIYIKKQLDEYIADRSISLGFLFLLSTIIILRSLMLLTGFPFDFVYMELFDPRHYASSLVNPSLGDLLLNLISLLVLGTYFFSYILKSGAVKYILLSSGSRQFAIASVCVFFSFFWLSVHHQTMKTLNFDSQWSMDITQNLEFDYLKVVGFVMFFISVVIYFLFSHVCLRLYFQLVQKNGIRFNLAVACGLILFIAFALLLRWDFLVVAVVNLFFFLVINFFGLAKYIGKIQYLTFIYFFAFGLPGAIIGLYANFQFNRNNTDFEKSRLANQLLVESDWMTEMQLTDAARKIKDDIYIRDRIDDPYASKLIIDKKIRREYLNNLDKFDIQIYAFNVRGEPFKEFNLRDNYNYHEFKSRLAEFRTDTEGLYFINQAGGQAASRFLYFIEIEERAQVIGYVLLELTQKKLVPNSVFPLLLTDNLYTQQSGGSNRYSYGVFNNGELQHNFGAFNYRKNFEALSDKSDIIFEKSVRIQGFNHKAFGEQEKVVVVSAKEASIGARAANFSFLFLIYVFSILLVLIAVTSYASIRRIKLNYATKIQLYLNFAFFAPLIIVSVTTVSIIIQTFKSSLENQYLEFADNLSAEISTPLSAYRNLEIDKEDLSEIVFQMAEIADLDVNVFHNKVLVASSLFQIYQNEILSQNIEPRAYIKIFEELESTFVQEEQVGLLKYKNVYVGIRSYETGKVIGILSLPFFASQQDLERNIVEVLSNIINIFTFVFVIFMFVSFFVSRGLTFPLRLITQKIKRTTLSSYNEPLSWNSDDEIGMMVTEYNRMLLNLEESKKALAKSEKESAWREMARQVAHEIKNPLTPMKLTLQHMKRVIDDGGDNGQQEKKKVQINNLLEQIETLSDIATSFSDFAKMPAPQMERLDLVKLLTKTIDLYNKKELGQIVTNIEAGRFKINGDKKWLGRAFSNLIINGFQAVNDPGIARIEVRLYALENSKIRLEFVDNGHGIPEQIQEKVFTPNFSTKFTGSGLGLAITKKGIEHAGGNIWFDSREGAGTTFYIEIPRS